MYQEAEENWFRMLGSLRMQSERITSYLVQLILVIILPLRETAVLKNTPGCELSKNFSDMNEVTSDKLLLISHKEANF